jgi:rhodanese-related sulfurtransferase
MLEDLDSGTPLAVYCSSIAASLLQRAGFRRVMNVIGGFDAWRACHLPYVVPAQASAALT